VEKQLEVGQEAPDFILSSTIGEKIRLSDYRGKMHVLVAFYPLDFTPG
jgi:peroxiredoxin